MAYGLKKPDSTNVLPGNDSLTAQQALDSVLQSANEDECSELSRWIRHLHDHKVTDSLLQEVNVALKPFEILSAPTVDAQTHRLTWEIARIDASLEVLCKRQYLEGRLLPRGLGRPEFERAGEEEERQPQSSSRRYIERHLSSPDPKNSGLEVTVEEERGRRLSLGYAAHKFDDSNSLYAQDYLKYEKAVNALLFAYLLDEGVLTYLRRCQRPKCAKFYIGGPRSKWCSPNCGGIMRTQAKRKRDKGNGSIESRYL